MVSIPGSPEPEAGGWRDCHKGYKISIFLPQREDRNLILNIISEYVNLHDLDQQCVWEFIV